MKKVLVFGSFDFIHPGHFFFFKEARKKGDKLVVVLARDSRIEKVKEEKPHYSEDVRKKMLEKLEAIDEVVMGSEDDIYTPVREIKPDVICLGYDQEADSKKLKAVLKEEGLTTEIFRIDSFNPHIFKSSKMKEEIKKYSEQPRSEE